MGLPGHGVMWGRRGWCPVSPVSSGCGRGPPSQHQQPSAWVQRGRPTRAAAARAAGPPCPQPPQQPSTYLESAWAPGDSPASATEDASPDFFLCTGGFLVLSSPPSALSTRGCNRTVRERLRGRRGVGGVPHPSRWQPCWPISAPWLFSPASWTARTRHWWTRTCASPCGPTETHTTLAAGHTDLSWANFALGECWGC